MDAATMDVKAARFLDEFGRAVFQQWQQQQQQQQAEVPLFWRDAQRLRALLQDAAAKLPRGPLKAHLARESDALAASLADKLDALHASLKPSAPVKKQPASGTALLNEADVERALTLHETAALAGICAVAGDDKDQESEDSEALVARVQLLVGEFAAVVARRYEAPDQQRSKCGALARRIADTVAKLAAVWAKDAWNVDDTASAAKQVDAVREALQTLVKVDALAIAAPVELDEVLAAPWTGFYRPQPSKKDAVDYEAELARVFAAFVALAVRFPVARASDSDSDSDSDNDSDATSDEEDNTKRKNSKRASQQLDAVPMAQMAVQRTVFAAQQRGRKALLASGIDRAWLVRVLTALSAMPKPASYTSEEDEEEDDGLSAEDWRAILECVGALYTQALASPSTLFESASDTDVLRAIVCVRQATIFMRTQRKQTLPAVSAASAALARVPLPHLFSTWIVEAKRQLRGLAQHEKLRAAVQNLSSSARATAGSDDAPLPASVLLSDSAVTLDMLLGMQLSFEVFVAATERDAKRAKRRQSQRPAIVVGDANGQQQPLEQPEALFFMDSAGGDQKQPGKRKRAA